MAPAHEPRFRSAAILAAAASMQTKRPAMTCIQPFPSGCGQDGRAPVQGGTARIGSRSSLTEPIAVEFPLFLAAIWTAEIKIKMKAGVACKIAGASKLAFYFYSAFSIEFSRDLDTILPLPF